MLVKSRQVARDVLHIKMLSVSALLADESGDTTFIVTGCQVRRRERCEEMVK